MDARRAAGRIVTAVERRRTRIVLTPVAKAAGVMHGVAPALTTRLSALAAKALPGSADTGDTSGLRQGRDVQRAAEERTPAAVRRLRKWGSALNDRAARALNPPHEQRP
jgi:hypothetical protein